jgi:hypothetical protein
MDALRVPAGAAPAGWVADRVAELNNKLAAVVVNAELLAGPLDPGDVTGRADRTLRAAWDAAAVARTLARELLGEPPLAGAAPPDPPRPPRRPRPLGRPGRGGT